MRVLVGCEKSQVITEAFINAGHEAMSCDLNYDGEKGLPHYKGDVLDILSDGWANLFIAHPPCTFNSLSSAQWRYHPEDTMLPKYARRPHPLYPNRKEDQQAAIDFFLKLWKCKVPRVGLENPDPLKSVTEQIGMYSQIIQPWQFGDSFQKKTCLWLRNLPRLKPTKLVDKGEFIITKGGKKLPKWYSDAKVGNKNKTQESRSRTFPGIAAAMADQWGSLPII